MRRVSLDIVALGQLATFFRMKTKAAWPKMSLGRKPGSRDIAWRSSFPPRCLDAACVIRAIFVHKVLDDGSKVVIIGIDDGMDAVILHLASIDRHQ